MIAPNGKGNGKNGGNGKAGENTGPLVPQPHGGAIYQGTPATIVPGPGRPPSRVKRALREDFDTRRELLNAIADGEPVQEIRVPILEVLKHAACPKCGEKLKADDAATLALVSVKGKISARPGDRIKALDVMAKYSDLESDKIDRDLIEELGTAVMAEVGDAETVRLIRDRWVDIVARRIAGV